MLQHGRPNEALEAKPIKTQYISNETFDDVQTSLYLVFIARHLASISLLLRYTEGRISACAACFSRRPLVWPSTSIKRYSNQTIFYQPHSETAALNPAGIACGDLEALLTQLLHCLGAFDCCPKPRCQAKRFSESPAQLVRKWRV